MHAKVCQHLHPVCYIYRKLQVRKVLVMLHPSPSKNNTLYFVKESETIVLTLPTNVLSMSHSMFSCSNLNVFTAAYLNQEHTAHYDVLDNRSKYGMDFKDWPMS